MVRFNTTDDASTLLPVTEKQRVAADIRHRSEQARHSRCAASLTSAACAFTVTMGAISSQFGHDSSNQGLWGTNEVSGPVLFRINIANISRLPEMRPRNPPPPDAITTGSRITLYLRLPATPRGLVNISTLGLCLQPVPNRTMEGQILTHGHIYNCGMPHSGCLLR